MTSEIQLTRKHLGRGLSDREIADYAGFTVTSCSLSGLPHWEALAAGEKLSIAQIEARAKALCKRVRGSGLKTPSGRPYNPEDLLEEAEQISPSVLYNVRCKRVFLEQDVLTAHFRQIATGSFQALDHGLARYDERDDSGRFVVFPAAMTENLDVCGIFIIERAFFLRDPQKDRAVRFWARAAGVPVEQIQNYPDDGCHILINELHEAGHLRQIKAQTSGLPAQEDVVAYYAELDADLFAERSLQQAGIGRDSILANRAARYLDLLYSDKDHWIAPALEAFGEGKNPPDCYQVWRAVGEIRTRLIRSATKDPLQNESSALIQEKIGAFERHPGFENDRFDDLSSIPAEAETYKNWRGGAVLPDPERVYGLLSELVQQGVFQEPLAAQSAARIVEAAARFCSNAVQTHDLQRKNDPKLPKTGAHDGLKPLVPA